MDALPVKKRTSGFVSPFSKHPDAVGLELADNGQDVHGVAGDATDSLGDNQVCFVRLFDTMQR